VEHDYIVLELSVTLRTYPRLRPSTFRRDAQRSANATHDRNQNRRAAPARRNEVIVYRLTDKIVPVSYSSVRPSGLRTIWPGTK
jgi:hypothetical protein